MSKLGISTGTTPNDGTGDTLLQGAVKVNSNFDEVYTFLGDGSSLTTIDNNKLTNSTVSYGGVQLSLGTADATPAFDLSDATNYPYSSLTGITTEIVGDTSPRLGGNLNLNSNDIIGTGNVNITGSVTATSFSGSGSNITGISTLNITNYGVGFITSGALNGYATENYVNSASVAFASTSGISSSVSNTININTSGIITASSFSGSGSGLTNLSAGELSGTLPALDGSALINLPAQPGNGINVQDSDSTVGSARTVNFGSGLEVQYNASAGIATINSTGGSLKSRTVVSGSTTSIANNGIGNTDITGFKSYSLMKVGLSTEGWLRIYTDSVSRDADVSRSVGEDPLPGSGVIAEVVTTGISTTQIISPFVNGGNLDEPATTTIYTSIKNLSGSTQAITANLTILQLEV